MGGDDASVILSKIDVVDVVSPHVSLRKTTSQYVGCCCFHDERHASFFVSRIKQSWYCFGCGSGGDAISFVRQMYSLDFKDALAYLAGSPVAHAEPIRRDTRQADRAAAQRQADANRAARDTQEMINTCPRKLHAYLQNKSSGHASALAKERGIVTPDDKLLIPLHDIITYTVVGGQLIWWGTEEDKPELGNHFIKRYVYGTPAHGAIFYIGSRDFPETIYCEGYATGLSIKAAIGPMRIKVGVCFSAGNLLKVAQATRGPGRFVFADNDRSGTGQRFAEQTGLKWIMPPEEGCDGNDWHQKHGVIAVRSLILKLRKQS